MAVSTNIILADDHKIFRNGFKLLLQKIKGINIISEAEHGKHLIELLIEQLPDIIFLDINMPLMDGIEAAQLIIEKYPDVNIIMLTTFSDTEYFHKLVNLGVQGYMLKNSDVEEFEKAIEKVMAGQNYYSADLLSNLTQLLLQEKTNKKKEEALPSFSKREIEVLKLVCKGFSNIAIGEKLFISDRTVERHKTNLMQKTNTENTLNLVLFALKNGLAEL